MGGLVKGWRMHFRCVWPSHCSYRSHAKLKKDGETKRSSYAAKVYQESYDLVIWPCTSAWYRSHIGSVRWYLRILGQLTSCLWLGDCEVGARRKCSSLSRPQYAANLFPWYLFTAVFGFMMDWQCDASNSKTNVKEPYGREKQNERAKNIHIYIQWRAVLSRVLILREIVANAGSQW